MTDRDHRLDSGSRTSGTRSGRAASDQVSHRPSGPSRSERETPRALPQRDTALRGGVVMAVGSVVSRATGFARSAVVAAALGSIGPTADAYAVGNTLPTIVYVMLLGGALNAVFVPELVKAATKHEDGGAAYTDRLLTAVVVGLAVMTLTAVWAAPEIIDLYTRYSGDQAVTAITFARYCLPQIFFLGLFTVLGQVLIARGRFGAMTWAPVLNNVVVSAVFGFYVACATDHPGRLTPTETAYLGWGTTAGVAVQALALILAVRAHGFRWRPRFDWHGSGLSHPLRSAGWLIMLVFVNQVAYWVITRLSTTVGATGAPGFGAYGNAYLLWNVPQGIITVSLMTALLPRMSAAAVDADLAAVRHSLSSAARVSATAIVPAACALFALAQPLMTLVFAHGRTSAADTEAMADILMGFAPGLVALSGQYVLSRGFYALSDTRSPFLLGLVIAGLNAAMSLTAYVLLPPRWAVTGMAAGYSVALWAGWALTSRVIGSRLAVPRPWRSATAGIQTRLLVTAVPGTLLGHWAAEAAAPAGPLAALATGSVAIVLTFTLLARPLRLDELVRLRSGARRRIARR